MAGGVQEDPDDLITQINVVPLVDIILVVLIIFMLTANLIARQSIEVELPEASTGQGVEPTTLALTLDDKGGLFLNGQPTDEDALALYLPEVVKTDPKAQAIIDSDEFGDPKGVKPKYALHGLVMYAARPGAEKQRKIVAETLAAELEGKHSKELKAFLCRQLQLCGRREEAPALEKLLEDDRLGEPARQALEAIGAGAALKRR